MIGRAALAATLLLGLGAPTMAGDSPAAAGAYDTTFLAHFERACIPGRLGFGDTRAQAEREGWTAVADDADPELEAMMTTARAAAVDPEYPDWKADFAVYSKPLLDRPAYLVVTYLVAPDIMNIVGCYLYDFAAEEMIDPALVTALLDQPLADSIDRDGLTGYVWGPSPKLPRTFDTYLTLIRSESPHVAETGFSGLMLKFETSEPTPE